MMGNAVTMGFRLLRQIGLLGCLAAANALAQESVTASSIAHSNHTEIAVSTSIAVENILQAALSRAPQRQLSGSYHQYAEDQRRASDSLVANAPRVNMSYWDDEANDATGLREMEAGIEVDLWQWGQRSNARQLAADVQEGSESWQTYLQLMVAGEVRATLHRLAEADARVEHAEAAVNAAQSLLRVSQQMFDTGATSRNELLQSEALVLEARQYLLQEQAGQVDAERSYFILTGLTERPGLFAESAPVHVEISAQHPQLRFLTALRQQQASKVESERFAAGDNTTVSFGMRRERGSAMEPDIESLGVAISIPFGGSSHRSAKASAAAIALAEADIRLQQAQRQLSMQLHETQHQLSVVEESIIYAQQGRDLLQERWAMTQKAFSLGESDIQPTILALRQYRESQLQLRLLELQRNALTSTLKQTVGELP